MTSWLGLDCIWNAQASGLTHSLRRSRLRPPQTEPRTLRFSLVDDLRIRHLAQRSLSLRMQLRRGSTRCLSSPRRRKRMRAGVVERLVAVKTTE